MMLDDGEIDRRLLESLRVRALAEKFWYASDAAADAWLALCRSKTYRNYDRAGRTVAEASDAIASAMRDDGEVEIVGLGAGDGAKELAIAEALVRAGVAARFLAVDVSSRLLDVAMAESARRGVPARAVRLDLDDPAHLAALPDGGRRIWTVLGNTIGALDRARALARLGRLVRPGDALLVDGEIFDRDRTFGGYDNPDNRRFAWGPLADLGLSEADGTLDFWMEDSGGGVHAVRKRFTFSVPTVVRGIPFAKGESLAMSRSEKYDAGRLETLVTAESGLAVRRSFDGERWTLVEAVTRE